LSHEFIPVAGQIDFDRDIAAAGHGLHLVAVGGAHNQNGRHSFFHGGDGRQLGTLIADDFLEVFIDAVFVGIESAAWISPIVGVCSLVGWPSSGGDQSVFQFAFAGIAPARLLCLTRLLWDFASLFIFSYYIVSSERLQLLQRNVRHFQFLKASYDVKWYVLELHLLPTWWK